MIVDRGRIQTSPRTKHDMWKPSLLPALPSWASLVLIPAWACLSLTWTTACRDEIDQCREYTLQRKTVNVRASLSEALGKAHEPGEHARMAHARHSLARTAWRQGHYAEAINWGRLAMNESLKAGDEKLQYESAQWMYLPLKDLGDWEGALHARYTMMSTFGSIAKDRRKLAIHFQRLGSWHHMRGHLEKACDLYEQSLNLALDVEHHKLAIDNYLNLIEVLVDSSEAGVARVPKETPCLIMTGSAQQRVRQARTYLAEATAIRDAKELDFSTTIPFYRALIHGVAGHYEAAQSVLKELQSENRDWRQDFAYQNGRMAEARGDHLSAVKYYQKAIEIIEEPLGKNDDPRAMMLDGRRGPYESLFALYVRKQRFNAALELLNRIKRYALQQALVEQVWSSDDSLRRHPLALWTTEALERVEYFDELSKIKASTAVGMHPGAPSMDRLVRSHEHVLAYLFANRDLYLVAVRRSGVQIQQRTNTPSERAQLKTLVASLKDNPDDNRAATDLANILLPAEMLPEPRGMLHIVTDDILGDISFAHLPIGKSGNQRYLVQDHTVVYIPSVESIATNRKRGNVEASGSIVFANTSCLPAVATEVEFVASWLRVNDNNRLVDANATRDNLCTGSNPYVVHVAGHAEVGALVLSGGHLSRKDILECGIAPRLTVIASCQSATGSSSRPGMWGSLGAAFLAAGSETVVASTRQIEDELASNFVQQFYKHGGVNDAAAAVAQVQRDWLKSDDGRKRKPSAWGPYIVMRATRKHLQP